MTVTGAVGAVTAASVVVATGQSLGLLAVALAASWWLAGWIAARARPDHPQPQLLLAVGAAHLLAFAVSAPVTVTTGTGWLPWAAGALGNLAFAVGFGALALALGLYPLGRARTNGQRLLLRTTFLAVPAAALLPALTSADLVLAVDGPRTSVPAPRRCRSDPWPSTPLLRFCCWSSGAWCCWCAPAGAARARSDGR